MNENQSRAIELLKNKAKFEEFIINSPMPVQICEEMQGYQNKKTEVIVDLTQNFLTFLNKVADDSFNPKQYLIWIITNEKEEILKVMQLINQSGNNGLGIFVFKAFLNDDEIDFKCLLKPNISIKREKNDNTPSKLMQKEYWEKYIEICDLSEYPDMQIANALPQHYQYISIGKRGVQIVQTVNTKDKYVASELFINNDKSIFNNLYEHKEDIESELGEIDWQYLENKKSSRIRKSIPFDISKEDIREAAINEHIKLAQEMTNVFSKYLK